MPSTREIRRRIRSVRNMSQITRAMEMVSASKMRRAQQNVTASRPYSERIEEVIADLSAIELDADEMNQFPLLQQREVKRSAVILITPDKGLTGSLNSNIIRRATRYVLHEANVPVEVIAAGKKGRDFMIRTHQEIAAEFTAIGDRPTLDDIRPIVEVALNDFESGKVDAVYVVYAKFVNTLSQVPEARQVLPIRRPEGRGTYTDYIFEPSPVEVLNALLPRYIEVQVYQAMLESIASEHSARMVAMRNATENAKDLVTDLSLSYNKARQSQITREVSEIAAGANALR
ncbi:MAG: F0F1 ATP synthase subunit gamma [Chloroflexota bacterium]|nr:F0F1 ATP synthase subunit gamma [Chloroflexia bacterium]MDQ3167369.1 F0F1 ATP synthase subunit gamma [Chloroflexota bacterium]MDQ3514039.1 F0F1 ATP synthase subunit gamma [Chloroflexota bacterium]